MKMKPKSQTRRRHVCVHLTIRTCTQIIMEKSCTITGTKFTKVGLYVIRKLCCHQWCARHYLEDSVLSSKHKIVSMLYFKAFVMYLKILSAVSCSMRDTFRRHFWRQFHIA